MIKWLFKLLNPVVDEAALLVMKKEYNDNPYIMVTATEKLTPSAIVEAFMRSETGKVLGRPYGSPIHLSPWNELLFNSRQIFEVPSFHLADIKTDVVIGKRAKKPIHLGMPIMITGMSYGGSLSLSIHEAFALASTLANTSTNTGESTIIPEVRKKANIVIGQYNRANLLNTHTLLNQVDGIEIQMGQGAWGGSYESITYSEDIDDKLRFDWNLNKDEDCIFHPQIKGIHNKEDFIQTVNYLKNKYDVPVGVKIAGTDFIEKELEVICQTNCDYIVIDGCEGGSSDANPTLEDNVGLPTLYSLLRAVHYLEQTNQKDQFDLIIAGGLKTPGDFAKAIALGASAVYIGSIALFAAIQSQATIALPESPPTQIALNTGKFKEDLNVDLAARRLSNFLNSCNEEIKTVLLTLNKNSIQQLNKEDLVSLNKEISEYYNIRYGISPRK